MKMRIFALIAIAVIVAVSGCVNQESRKVTASDNDGIVINEFSVTPLKINDDETAIFTMEIENVGGTTATNIRANLYGVEGWQTPANEVVYSQLDPPNINIEPQTPGEFKMMDWELLAPDLPEGISVPYNVKGRVRYHYHTTNVITIPVYEKKEYIRRNQIGAVIDTINVANVRAPVKVDIDPADYIVYDTEDVNETYSRRLIFSNTGSGVPIGQIDGKDVDGVITGTVKIDGPAEFADCIGAASGKSVDIPAGEVKIRQSESVRKACALKINADEFGSSPVATVSLIMDLDYDYYVESAITIEVAGQK